MIAIAGAMAFSGALGRAEAASNTAQIGTPAASTITASGPTVVVNGTGEASAPADGAIVQLVVHLLGVADAGSGGSDASQASVVSPQSSPPTKDQIKRVTDALVKSGIAKDQIASAIMPVGPFYGQFGQGTAVIAFQLNGDQAKKASKFVGSVLKIGEEAGLAFDAVNLVYTTADCASVANDALAGAIADATAQGQAMASALGRSLGDLVQAVSQSSYGKSYAGGGGSNYCSQPASLDDALTSYFSSFDPNAKAVVEIYANVSLTFALK